MMGRTICFFVFLLLVCQPAFTQVNLVLNPSFEDTIQCVPTHSRFQGYVSNWRGGDGEYYSQYCQGFQVEVPTNVHGHQYPHGGAAYAGIYTIINDNVPSHNNARDYIEGQLDTSLSRGERYYVGAFVSFGEIDEFVTPFQFSFISDTLSYDQYIQPLPVSVEENDLIRLADTTNWGWVGGFYTANGLETHLVMGNFQYDSLTPLYIFNSSAAQPTCYYFIDDVAVYRVADARAGQDIEICIGDSVQIGGLFQPGLRYRWTNAETLSDSTSAFPVAHPAHTSTYVLTIEDTTGNYYPGIFTDTVTVFVDSCLTAPPTHDWFMPSLLSGPDHFISGVHPTDLKFDLYDAQGRLVYSQPAFNNLLSADQFAAGVYVVVITESGGNQFRKKIVISGE